MSERDQQSADKGNDAHEPGKTDLAGIADRIKAHREQMVDTDVAFMLLLYRHESIDVEAELRMRSAGTRITPQGHDEAQELIAGHVQQIQIIADAFGYDPFEWLADEGTPRSATERRSERDYCEACGYTDSHDPNCPRPKP